MGSGHYPEVMPHRRVAFTGGGSRAQGTEPQANSLAARSFSGRDRARAESTEEQLVHLRHSHVPKDIAQRHGERRSHYLAQLEATVGQRQGEGFRTETDRAGLT